MTCRVKLEVPAMNGLHIEWPLAGVSGFFHIRVRIHIVQMYTVLAARGIAKHSSATFQLTPCFVLKNLRPHPPSPCPLGYEEAPWVTAWAYSSTESMERARLPALLACIPFPTSVCGNTCWYRDGIQVRGQRWVARIRLCPTLHTASTPHTSPPCTAK